MGEGTGKASNNYSNDIWKYGDRHIALYVENPAIWEQLGGYSGVEEVAQYYNKGSRKVYARQYIAPLEKGALFRIMLGM